MGWRILQITKPCKLSVQQKQLLYQSDDTNITMPIEDLSVVILETGFVQLTGSLLAEFAMNDVVLLVCDASHLPSGTFFSFHSNSRYSEMAHVQVSSSEPLKKRIWQLIVRQKILNQSSVLGALGIKNALHEIVKQVQSGDSSNREAYAAQIYWRLLFGDFTRRDDANIINKALNYGYAVVRGCVARNLVASGLLPCFGIHHDNQLNQFNLVDDIMEPFRPFVDYCVAKIDFTGCSDLSPELKNRLISVLLCNVNMNGDVVSVLKSAEMMSASLAKAFRQKDSSLLKLPVFDPSLLNMEVFE